MRLLSPSRSELKVVFGGDLGRWNTEGRPIVRGKRTAMPGSSDWRRGGQ